LSLPCSPALSWLPSLFVLVCIGQYDTDIHAQITLWIIGLLQVSTDGARHFQIHGDNTLFEAPLHVRDGMRIKYDSTGGSTLQPPPGSALNLVGGTGVSQTVP
jgi:hypothetical protein